MPTSKDVAAAAGVSQSTVSYVMSGKRPISEKTRKKVEAAIEQLTYQPNAGARALASRRTNVLGLVIPLTPDAHVGSLSEFIAVIAATARQHDRDILLVTDEEGTEGLQRVVGQQLCDGLILMQVEADDDRIPVVRKLRVPVVFIGIPNEAEGLSCIDADFALAGRQCIEEFAAAGHQGATVIGWRPESGDRKLNFVDRFLGGAFEQAEASGLALSHVSGSADIASIEAAVDGGIAAADGPPAFASPEEPVLEMLPRILLDRGLKPGVDVSIIGVGTQTKSLGERLRLTTIDLEPRTVSRRAVELLCNFLKDGDGGQRQHLELIPPVVTQRDSTIPSPTH
ncbi:LacI family DNA-binding transcriptional regulator [Arthrobacter sp. ISL-30]|uniref:LacI family DNA-binding transcriptional regulator n=1 Tax=Arthrobacter sp. ISL-30 TaxID=2819109 RepID=UPI001BEC1F8A|nr:LacI family DNA-binding transcriptional regulator [Arthrobacter sp. ISL-30]MBT2514871.1 LacI family DNA-binding transcriptional regulator [Arthrobacter sp. ISL-30]